MELEATEDAWNRVEHRLGVGCAVLKVIQTFWMKMFVDGISNCIGLYAHERETIHIIWYQRGASGPKGQQEIIPNS